MLNIKNYIYNRTHLDMPSFPIRFLESIFFKSWWLIAIILISTIIFERGVKGIDNTYEKLRVRAQELIKEKQHLREAQEDLKLQVNSQSDPTWIELTLIKELGLVPEDTTKVYFEP